jgi:large subunit ribosomal protein L18
MDRREKVEARARRKKRVRVKVQGTASKPRLCVFKSLKQIYAQLIDDTDSKVITGASTLSKEVKRCKIWRKCGIGKESGSAYR